MATPLLDTHAHLTDPQFADDLPAILSRAAARNVSAIICVSIDTDDAADALALAAHHPCVHAAVGLHPETVSNITDAAASAAVARLAALLASHRGAIVAVGEIGLDHTPRVLTSAAAIGSPDAIRARQHAVFNACLRLAREHGLPVSVHSRGAGRHAVDAVCAAAHAPGRRWAVLHAFDGRAAHAERGAAAGCMFSVPPAVARGEQMQKLVRRLPLAALLLESDAPALAAVAGERNEPGEVVRALDMIAAQKGVPAEEAARAMDATARTVFPLVFVGDNGVR